jgi:hypothetical protein
MTKEQKAYIQTIADNLAAETMARAAIIRAQAKRKGKELDQLQAINAALLAMICEGPDNDA